jgi:hypothetical protein
VEQQSSTVKASSQLGRSALASSWLVVRNRSGTGSATKERCSACAGGAPTAARTVVIVSVRTMHPQPTSKQQVQYTTVCKSQVEMDIIAQTS